MTLHTKILLTGHPGCGKTTLIRQVIARIPAPVTGFYTQELRSAGRCVGFELITIDGQQRVLAHVDIRSRHRIGKYGVDIASLDELAVPALYQGIEENGLIVVDEIGPMEIISSRFRQAVLDILENPARVLGTIVKRSIPYTDALKTRPDIELIHVQPDHREQMVQELIERLSPGRIHT
jgi:nucleoside-triphosphatase